MWNLQIDYPVPTLTENDDLKIVLHEWDDYSSIFALLQSFQEIRRGKWQERQARQGLLNQSCKITKINKRSLKESIVDLSGGYNVGCLFALPLAWIISSGFHLQIQIHRSRSF